MRRRRRGGEKEGEEKRLAMKPETSKMKCMYIYEEIGRFKYM